MNYDAALRRLSYALFDAPPDRVKQWQRDRLFLVMEAHLRHRTENPTLEDAQELLAKCRREVQAVMAHELQGETIGQLGEFRMR